MSPRPDRPWRPTNFSVFPVSRGTREVWVTNGKTGARERKPKVRFYARYRADGHDFRVTFDQKGWAEAFTRQLEEGYARGWVLDPASRRFIDPVQDQPAEAVTVVDHFADYVARRWPNWQPATRRNNQLELARAALFLTREGAPALPTTNRTDADNFLRRTVLAVPPAGADGDEVWAAWFRDWSLALPDVTDRHLQDFLDHVRTVGPDGARRELKPSSIARTRAVVRAAFTYARKRRLIEWDPWDAVEGPVLRDHERVDPDLVMMPSQVLAIAALCAHQDPRLETLILVMGICGLRPGETIALRNRDVVWEGPRPVGLTVRATHSSIPDRYFVDGESRRRPLKGRGAKATRTVPLPPPVADAIHRHPSAQAPATSSRLLFASSTGRPMHLSNLHRDIWKPAKQQMFASDDPLRGARLHDLRHAAITLWLNAGVPLKTAQAWSGHKTLSVLLDTYLGVMRGDQELALARLTAALGEE